MERNISRLLVAIFAVALTASCDSALNIDPTDRYSTSTVWSSTTSADQYLIGLYNFVKSNTGNITGDENLTTFDDAYSDLIKSCSWNQYGHPFNMYFLQSGAFNSTGAGCFECWSECYDRIRRCNEFIVAAEKYGPSLSDDYAVTRNAEARFIRALAYFKLMRVYGKCIIRDAVDGPDENDKALATPDEVWDMIVDDLTYAGENIRTSQARGRATRAAAWGMLSRVALYAERWDTVIEAAQKCAECGGKLDSSYSNVFTDVTSPENLLCVEFVSGKIYHYADQFFRPKGDSKNHSDKVIYAAFNPTSELVDSYEMADGSEFSWSANGDDPYTGREPRFYASILYNGASWEGRQIEAYEGGEDGIVEFNTSSAAGSTVTGYYLRKFITENQEGWEITGSTHFGIAIRYAEVLLNAAEAYAQKSQFTEALAALNQVRARVGLPARTSSTLDAFMKDLRHERVVELAGEGQRFWDLRRWRLAYCSDSDESVIDGKNFHGCWITKNGNNLSYKQVICDGNDGSGYLVHFFPERYYAFSLPVEEISNNALVTSADNNIGW